MPSDSKKTEGNLKWPPEKTVEYSITKGEDLIKSGEYIEIQLIKDERSEERGE